MTGVHGKKIGVWILVDAEFGLFFFDFRLACSSTEARKPGEQRAVRRPRGASYLILSYFICGAEHSRRLHGAAAAERAPPARRGGVEGGRGGERRQNERRQGGAPAGVEPRRGARRETPESPVRGKRITTELFYCVFTSWAGSWHVMCDPCHC